MLVILMAAIVLISCVCFWRINARDSHNHEMASAMPKARQELQTERVNGSIIEEPGFGPTEAVKSDKASDDEDDLSQKSVKTEVTIDNHSGLEAAIADPKDVNIFDPEGDPRPATLERDLEADDNGIDFKGMPCSRLDTEGLEEGQGEVNLKRDQSEDKLKCDLVEANLDLPQDTFTMESDKVSSTAEHKIERVETDDCTSIDTSTLPLDQAN